MPFNDSAILILAAARQYLGIAPSAVELFYQTVDVSDAMLDHLATHPHVQAEILAELRALSPQQRRPLIKRIYQMLGFADWVAIDSYPDHGNLVMDFNRNFTASYGYTQQFDLVSNKGSTEHIFDQRAAFENMHNLCRKGGVMVHDAPTLNIFNHAFYGYHPLFFLELAEANRYQVLDLRLGNRWGDTVRVRVKGSDPDPQPDYLPDLPDHPLPPFIERADFTAKVVPSITEHPLAQIYRSLELRGLQRREGNPGEIFVLAVLRKVKDVPFQVPYQGKFLSYIQTLGFQERYRNQLLKHGLVE
jgi:SAM-dependent methyltransferase